MPHDNTVNLLRTLFVVFAGCIGLMVGGELRSQPLTGAGLGIAFGLIVVLMDRLMKGISLRIFSSATFGMLVGFVFSHLLIASNVLKGLSDESEWVVSLAVYAAFAYLGMMLAVQSNRDEFALMIPYVRFRRASVQDDPVVVDSNVIIDGRLAELCSTGFVSSGLIVPRFVLEELQRLADSADSQKRERGRNALERLEELQANSALAVTIHDGPADSETAVDMKLIHAAQMLNARILTNDGNLSAIARLQGVQVLNMNELRHAIRPRVEPGRVVELALVKEGRDVNQAVGYLSDGTMIVVNNGRSRMGQTVPVVITSALQTSAGRLFFGELKEHPAAYQ